MHDDMSVASRAQPEARSEPELIVAVVSAIHLMSTAMPSLLTDKLATLLPYLQPHSSPPIATS